MPPKKKTTTKKKAPAKKTAPKKKAATKATGKKAPARKPFQRDKDETYFDTIETAHAYINDELGRKVGTSKLSADAGRRYPKQPDGSIAKTDLDIYANKHLNLIDRSDKVDLSADGKSKEEALLIRIKRKRAEYDFELEKGRHILKTDYEHDLAARAALLKDSIGPNFIHRYAEDIIELVGGDLEKAADLITFWLASVAEHLDQYSKPVDFAAPGVIQFSADDEMKNIEEESNPVKRRGARKKK